MDKKYTSLENQIRNVVHGILSETKNNKSLESKIRDVVLNEGSEKFAKIVARTAAARGEPVTTDVGALEKKHAELQAIAVAAAQHAAQTRKDYEDLAKKYGITPEPIGDEVGLDEAPDSADPDSGAAASSRNRAKIDSSETMKKEGYIITPTGRSALEEGGRFSNPLPALASLFRGGGKSAGKLATGKPSKLASAGKPIPKAPTPASAGEPIPKAPTPAKGKPANKSGAGSVISKMATGAGIVAVATELLGGGGAAAGANKTSSETGDGAGGAGGDISNLSVNRHYTKGRAYYGPEIHYNEYQPDGDHIDEDSAEQTDAKRSAIENVARPNSKNRLAKQAEIQRKIIEDTQRRKAVILRAKEENKNGKDGANGMIETKPELKKVHEEGEFGSALVGAGTYAAMKAAGKLMGKRLPLIGPAFSAADAYHRYKNGDDTGAAIAAGSGILGTIPYPLTQAASFAGDMYNLRRDDPEAFDKNVAAVGNAIIHPVDTYNSAKKWLTSPSDESEPAKQPEQPEQPAKQPEQPKPAETSTVAVPKPTNTGSAMGTADGKAITKVAPKSAPKPALKLPGPGTPGYRTDAQMAQAEADRARLLNANPNSVGARSAGNRSVEAATKSLNTNTPVVAPQPSPGINSTNTEAPRTMGSSWNNSYKNKYSMGPGPSQFPSK